MDSKPERVTGAKDERLRGPTTYRQSELPKALLDFYHESTSRQGPSLERFLAMLGPRRVEWYMKRDQLESGHITKQEFSQWNAETFLAPEIADLSDDQLDRLSEKDPERIGVPNLDLVRLADRVREIKSEQETLHPRVSRGPA